MAQVSFKIAGMHCASCVGRVEDALRAIPSVHQVSVSLPLEQAKLEVDEPTPELVLALKAAIQSAGYKVIDSNVAAKEDDLTWRLIVSAILTLPVFIISMAHIHFPYRDGLLALLCLPLQFWCGWPFMSGAWKLAQRGQTDMNSLITLGTLSALVYSFVITLSHPINATGGEVYYESQAVIITLVLFGRWLENKAKQRTNAALKSLMQMQPTTARLFDPITETEQAIEIHAIKSDDLLLLKAGDRIPVDGIVIEGQASVDESMLTGESMPVLKQKDSELAAGTINRDGRLVFRAVHIGAETQLARIIALVQDAQMRKASVERLADRVARLFVPFVIGLALLAGVGWLVYGFSGNSVDTNQTITRALTAFVATLIIACPCALGLATPTAIIAGTGRGAELGVLLKGGDVLEKASRIQTILFDKTGTLTRGQPTVSSVHFFSMTENMNHKNLLDNLYVIESASQHPWAQAIQRYCSEYRKNTEVPSAVMSSFEEHPGMGVSATANGEKWQVGNAIFMAKEKINQADALTNATEKNAATAIGTQVYFARDGQLLGYFVIEDELRPEAKQAIEQLKKSGYACHMVTGDQKNTALYIATQLGIAKVHAEVRPDQKAALVKQLQMEGHSVAMVGDGINDAPALAQANVGIVLGSGTDIALETGDMVLIHNQLTDVAVALRLSANTLWTIRSNLFFAFVYNLIGLPLAALNLLNPMIAAGAMAMSSVSVVANSLRLRRFQP